MTLRIRTTLATLALWPLASIAFAQAPAAPAASAPHSLEDFLRKGRYDAIKISPGGEYYAATVRQDRKTSLAIVRRADGKLVANLHLPGEQSIVHEFWWVSDTRVAISAATQVGEIEQPELTGDLLAINVDGTRGDLLVGPTFQGYELSSRVLDRRIEPVFASMLDTLEHDDNEVLVHVSPLTGDPYTRVDRMDVFNGRRTAVARAPVRNAWFTTDNKGQVRFAWGHDEQNVSRMYYRDGDGAEWRLMADESKGRREVPIGFSPDDRIAYLRVEMPTGPDALVAWDIAAGTRTEVARDDDVDPIPMFVDDRLVGVRFEDGLPRTQFFDPNSSVARLQGKLERAFQGARVEITSITRDGTLAMVRVDGDRNPGDFYVYDTRTNRAEWLLGRQEWMEPDRLAPMRPVKLKARDGLDLHGFLTAPFGGEARNGPLVLLVHGGPFDVYDRWSFDKDAQILAAHGYAVLQVNFRGSGNYGAAFRDAGRRQWGRAMQDDLADAARWAVEQGIADPARICIYGASYGGYASLMGVAKDPGLYRCAIGYVGVYDLAMMHDAGDIQLRASGQAYIEQWIGPKAELQAVSPALLADRIAVPVLLAAGGLDRRTPIEHTRKMEQALRARGKEVAALYYPTEGHGFYNTDNEREFYTAVLDFLARHIGGRPAAPAPQASGR